ncbi:hypothetical protein J3Q64DRAFT_1852688 [Phycomyces blakesleeanus]
MDDALTHIAMHKAQQQVIINKLDAIMATTNALQAQNSSLIEELRVANEYIGLLHNQLQLQAKVPGDTAFPTIVLQSMAIDLVEYVSAVGAAHSPATIPTPSPTTFLAAAKKTMDKILNHPKLTTAQTSRALQPESRPSAYAFVYLRCHHHLKYCQVPKLLRTLKIQQLRVLDIVFPERGSPLILCAPRLQEQNHAALDRHISVCEDRL